MKTEAEQLLYYSIPGFFMFFFVFMFLIVIGITDILETRMITFVVASVIPVGFVVYQAYIRTLYRWIWKKQDSRSDPCILFLERELRKHANSLSESVRKKVTREISPIQILLFTMHKGEDQEIINYSWRMVNLINARGVGVFSCILGLLVPIAYAAHLYFSSPIFPALPPFKWQASYTLPFLIIAAYHLLVLLFALILWSGIRKIQKNLADINTGILIEEYGNLKQRLLGYVAVKATCIVDSILSEKMHTETSRGLIEKAYGDIESKKWEEAIKKASKAYDARAQR